MPLSRRMVISTTLASPAILRRAFAQTDKLAIGALYPFSGTLALLGDESYRGLELAVEERNGGGGLTGQQIRLVKGDAADPNQAVAEARRLLTTEKVAAIFGTFASALVFAASQVTELAGIPYFELGAIADPVTERGFKYLFRSCPVASAFAAETVEAVQASLAPLWGIEPAALKLAIANEDGLYGSSVSNVQAALCKQAGLHVVERMTYSAGTSDVSSLVQRLRGAAADVVLHTGYQNDIVLFFRQMRQVGWKPRMVIGAGGGYSLADTAAAVGPDFEGAMNVDFTPYAVNEAAAPGVREVEAAYQKKYGAKPRSGHSLANYAGAKLFLGAIEQAGGLDKDKVRAAVLALDAPFGTLPTGWGAKFDEKGQNTRGQPFLMQWQGGTEATLLPAGAAVAKLRPNLGA